TPTIAPSEMMMGMSIAVKPNVWSTNSANSDSNAARPNEEMRMTMNALKYMGEKIFLNADFGIAGWFSSSSYIRSGPFNVINDRMVANKPKPAAKKKGRRVLISARKPPIPGPMMKPVEMAADI